MQERSYYLGFSLFHGIGPIRFGQLLAHFETAKEAWESPVGELKKVLGEITLAKFDAFRKKQKLEKLADTLAEKEIGYVCVFEKEYPALLKKCSAAPFLLFYKGNIDALQSAQTVGVVGTRKITEYGREVTRRIVRDLVDCGFVIVSGLALGVDGVAHQTTVDMGGQTIAVLGSGVDICTPTEHQRLYQDILEKNGCIISAAPPGERPMKGSFPARNRIVAGLSQGVVVTEGAEDSGALITAQYAKDFGRLVFAVPGPITSTLSKGPHSLIREGAVMVSSGYDIMVDLQHIIPANAGIQKNGSRVKPGMTVKGHSEEEAAILLLLATGPLHFDDIVRKISKDSKEVGSLLSLMELKGMVKSNSQGEYIRG